MTEFLRVASVLAVGSAVSVGIAAIVLGCVVATIWISEKWMRMLGVYRVFLSFVSCVRRYEGGPRAAFRAVVNADRLMATIDGYREQVNMYVDDCKRLKSEAEYYRISAEDLMTENAALTERMRKMEADFDPDYGPGSSSDPGHWPAGMQHSKETCDCGINAELHLTGRCTCGGEGTCKWCVWSAFVEDKAGACVVCGDKDDMPIESDFCRKCVETHCTCTGCAGAATCRYVWDGYNTNGDCLDSK